jgi:uncharacterized damage-inducible protein DinB
MAMKNSSVPDYFKRLFEYNFSISEKLFELFFSQQGQIPEKVIQLACHISNAHFIWNSRILEYKIETKPWESFPIEDFLKKENANLDCTLRILEELDLTQPRVYKNSMGNTFENRVSDILTHVVNHGIYHRGQIAMILRENGLNPVPSDFIYFARELDLG